MQKEWDSIEFFNNGDNYFNRLIDSINNAQTSIYIEVYIFSIDPLTQKIIEALIQAKKRGLDIKVMVDGIGSFSWVASLKGIFDPHQIEFRVFKPIRWAPLVLLKSFPRIFQIIRKTNKRNHRKIVLIDDIKAYIGSFNFIYHHSEKIAGDKSWHDTAVSISGAPLHFLINDCKNIWNIRYHFWNYHQPDKSYHPQNALIRLHSVKRWRKALYADLLNRINNAQSQILITSAYFLPKYQLIKALIKAAGRGVSVQIIIPGPSDIPIVKWAFLHLAHRLTIKSGERQQIKIFEYQNHILHSKYLLIDQICIIGSANLNYRSFTHDLEVEVLINSPPVVETIRKQWLEDSQHSFIFSDLNYQNMPIIKKVLSYLAFKIRYWL